MDDKQRGSLKEASRLVAQAHEIVKRIAAEEDVKHQRSGGTMPDRIEALGRAAYLLGNTVQRIEEALD